MTDTDVKVRRRVRAPGATLRFFEFRKMDSAGPDAARSETHVAVFKMILASLPTSEGKVRIPVWTLTQTIQPYAQYTAGFASLCTEVNTLSRNNQSTLTVFDTIFRKLLLYAFALLRFWNMLYERKRSPWTSKMAGDEVRLREQLRPESTSRVAIPASSAPQRALAPAM